MKFAAVSLTGTKFEEFVSPNANCILALYLWKEFLISNIFVFNLILMKYNYNRQQNILVWNVNLSVLKRG